MFPVTSQDTEATENEESVAPVATGALNASVSPLTLANKTETFLTAEASGAFDAQAKENKVSSKTDASATPHPYYPQIAHAKVSKAPSKPKEKPEKDVTKGLANLDIAQDSKTREDKGKGKETAVDSGHGARTTAEKGKEKAGKAIFDDKPIPKTPMQGLKGVLEDAFIVTTVSKDTIHPFYMSLRVSITIQKKNSMPLGTSNSYLIDRQTLDSLNYSFYDGMKNAEKNCLKSLATTVFDKNGALIHSTISGNWNDRISKGNFLVIENINTPFIHRRKGVGRGIVKAIIGEAEERGVMFCFVCPEAPQQKGCPKKAPSQVNEPAIPFFKTLGFRPIGTTSCTCILTRNKTFHLS